MGLTTTDFADLVASVGPASLNKNENIFNDATFRNHSIARLMAGGDFSTYLRNGENITGDSFFDDGSTYDEYEPGDIIQPSNPQVVKKHTYHWRRSRNYMSWNDDQILVNGSAGMGGSMAEGKRFFDEYKKIERRAMTSQINGMETSLWREPDSATMNANAGKRVNSIPMFINEDPNGLFARNGTTFTEIGGISPATESNWRIQQGTYGSAASGNVDNMVGRMRDMSLKLKFESAMGFKEWMEAPSFRKMMIKVSRVGHLAYTNLLEQGNDQFLFFNAGRQDTDFPNPQFQGVPVEYCEQLDTATLYDDGSSDNTSEGLANIAGPRVYFINGEYLHPVFHELRYLEKDTPIRDVQKPDSWVCYIWTMWQMVCTSLRRQGILSPDKNLYTSLY